jgi:Heterokaryon incompatibility protein (HET)
MYASLGVCVLLPMQHPKLNLTVLSILTVTILSRSTMEIYQEEHRSYSAGNKCNECSKLDFETMFRFLDGRFQRREMEENVCHIRLGGLVIHSFEDRLPKPSSCELCQFFRTMRAGRDDQKRYDLMAFDITNSHIIRFRAYDKFKSEATSQAKLWNSAIFAVLPKGTWPKDQQKLLAKGNAIYRSGLAYRVTNTPENAVWGSRIGCQVDFSIVSGWLNFCRNSHQRSCGHQTRTPNNLQLIDCATDPPVVKTLAKAEKYVALSYVWGAHQEEWPKVILDAIWVTKTLGLQYLWVDRYCIDKTNVKEKHYMISQMDNIYEGAEMTIVAAGGKDASFGLPGVRSTPRRIQPCLHLNELNVDLVSCLSDPKDTLQSSTWNSRGWTYQEAILSRRLLIFTEEQIYWECGAMTLQETLTFRLSHVHVLSTQLTAHSQEEADSSTKMAYYMKPGIFVNSVSMWNWRALSDDRFDTSIEEACRRFSRHVEAYSQKSLTFGSDALYALEGIFQRYCFSPSGNLRHILGLPIVAPTRDATVLATYSLPIGFALSLATWDHYRTDKVSEFRFYERRQQFPSWTWAGWREPLKFRTCLSEDPDILRLSIDEYNGQDWWTPQLHLWNNKGIVLDWRDQIQSIHANTYRLVVGETYILPRPEPINCMSSGFFAFCVEHMLQLSVTIPRAQLNSLFVNEIIKTVLVLAYRTQRRCELRAYFIVLRSVKRELDIEWERIGSLRAVLNLADETPIQTAIEQVLQLQKSTSKYVVA